MSQHKKDPKKRKNNEFERTYMSSIHDLNKDKLKNCS
jgi:hypothetical protein